MAFMSKKKRYKFAVQCCLEELTEVPFLSAVLFAKVRLLHGGNFQDHSSRVEVRNHTVQWNAQFSFECKMSANVTTGVLEPSLMRVSVRKECKGGRSYQKLGFCDVNLAELAGSGETTRRCLLEGYEITRNREDNSVLRIRIRMSMISGDPLFKVPERKQEVIESSATTEGSEGAPDDDCGSSIASSGFGSLTKKKQPYEMGGTAAVLSSLAATDVTPDEDPPGLDLPDHPGVTVTSCAPAAHSHSRNSSNTSGDMSSKASGYGSSASAQSQHSRQGSEGEADSHRAHHSPPERQPRALSKLLMEQTLVADTSEETFLTPNSTLTPQPDVIPRHARALLSPPSDEYRTPDTTMEHHSFAMPTYFDKKRKSVAADAAVTAPPLTNFQMCKQKSLNTIPSLLEKSKKNEELFNNFPFLTPLAHRKNSLVAASRLSGCIEDEFYCIGSEGEGEGEGGSLERVDVRHRLLTSTPAERVRPHTLAGSLRHSYAAHSRNPSSGSASASESGSLERARAAWERRPRSHQPPHQANAAPPPPDDQQFAASCRVENTRVNPDSLIDELLAATGFPDHVADDAAETSGLQLFIARDGTAELGSRRRGVQRVRVQLQPAHR